MKEIRKLKLNTISAIELEKREMKSLHGGDGCGCVCDSGVLNSTYNMAVYEYYSHGGCQCECYCNGGLSRYGNDSQATVMAVTGGGY